MYEILLTTNKQKVAKIDFVNFSFPSFLIESNNVIKSICETTYQVKFSAIMRKDFYRLINKVSVDANRKSKGQFLITTSFVNLSQVSLDEYIPLISDIWSVWVYDGGYNRQC